MGHKKKIKWRMLTYASNSRLIKMLAASRIHGRMSNCFFVSDVVANPPAPPVPIPIAFPFPFPLPLPPPGGKKQVGDCVGTDVGAAVVGASEGVAVGAAVGATVGVLVG